jgi:hypothetical protein
MALLSLLYDFEPVFIIMFRRDDSNGRLFNLKAEKIELWETATV